MGGVVDHLKPVSVCYGLYLLHIADISIYMHRHYRRGLIGYERLYPGNVHCVIRRVNIAEYRCKPGSHNRMSSRRKSKGSGNYLPFQLQRPYGIFQSHMSVHDQRNTGNSQILLQLLRKLIMLCAHIGQPMSIPYGSYLFNIFIQRRHRRTCNQSRHVSLSLPSYPVDGVSRPLPRRLYHNS